MNLPATVTAEFVEFSRWKLLDQYWPRLRECARSLSDEQIWWRPNQASNSIGNLMLHLNGNVGQWLIAPFLRLEDARNRPAEFAQRDAIPAASLIDNLDATMKQAAEVFSKLTEQDLAATFHIQGYTVTGLHAVYQVVEHFGMHYGQILYITKILQSKDLGFYRELTETGRLPNA